MASITPTSSGTNNLQGLRWRTLRQQSFLQNVEVLSPKFADCRQQQHIEYGRKQNGPTEHRNTWMITSGKVCDRGNRCGSGQIDHDGCFPRKGNSNAMENIQ